MHSIFPYSGSLHTPTDAGCIQQPAPPAATATLLLPQVQQLLNTLVVDTEIAEMELQVCVLRPAHKAVGSGPIQCSRLLSSVAAAAGTSWPRTGSKVPWLLSCFETPSGLVAPPRCLFRILTGPLPPRVPRLLQIGTFKMRVRRNIDSPDAPAPVPVMYASPAAAAAAPAAAAAVPAPYLSLDEPQYESLDEAKVYVTVPKVCGGRLRRCCVLELGLGDSQRVWCAQHSCLLFVLLLGRPS